MNITSTKLSGLYLVEPVVFEDDRGLFMESWNQATLDSLLGPLEFVQDNHSVSKRGVLRGLHYQLSPAVQGKLVRCVSGAIWDVAVDIRSSSPTFGEWLGFELTPGNRRMLWIPEGFAHGFVALDDDSIVLYKATSYYAPESERTIRWDDPALAIDWPIVEAPNVSPKDEAGASFEDAEVFS